MIRAVRANHKSFRTVEFTQGFNVVLADRTKESTRKESRNGLGKTTLLEIIHFCLGARTTKGKGLLVSALSGWEFTLDLRILGRNISVRRGTDNPTKIFVDPPESEWAIRPRRDGTSGEYYLTVTEWTELLGSVMFGLDTNSTRKYQPTFRSLISFVVRHESGAFLDPFVHFARMVEFDKQVNNAYLLGLAWEDASDWQVLKDQEKLLSQIKQSAKAGLMTNLMGSVGELEASRVRLDTKIRETESQLKSFRVHDQYRVIEERANSLTAELQRLANDNIADRQLLSLYEASLLDESEPDESAVVRVYQDAGVELPGMVCKHLDDVKGFYKQLISNRRNFLIDEIETLRRKIQDREAMIRRKSDQRSGDFEILQSHGALEEYSKLQQRHLDTVAELNEINIRIENLRRFQQGISSLHIESELLRQRAMTDYEERRPLWQEAISLFNANSEHLYRAPGKLVIDITKNGFRFDVDIERSGSQGIDRMKIFCYDIMLAQLWSAKLRSPRMLIHDSTLFDGVDERQVALALELAAREAEASGFQYICTLNSDAIPWKEFSPEFNLENYVALTLTDLDESGSLLGVRF